MKGLDWIELSISFFNLQVLMGKSVELSYFLKFSPSFCSSLGMKHERWNMEAKNDAEFGTNVRFAYIRLLHPEFVYFGLFSDFIKCVAEGQFIMIKMIKMSSWALRLISSKRIETKCNRMFCWLLVNFYKGV
jgi:hypothetical protein